MRTEQKEKVKVIAFKIYKVAVMSQNTVIQISADTLEISLV